MILSLICANVDALFAHYLFPQNTYVLRHCNEMTILSGLLSVHMVHGFWAITAVHFE